MFVTVIHLRISLIFAFEVGAYLDKIPFKLPRLQILVEGVSDLFKKNTVAYCGTE